MGKARPGALSASELDELRLNCARRIAALAAALRSIPEELAPVRRASSVAVREQIYYGYEVPVGRARGTRLLFGKYELDGWWSEAAADLVISGHAARGSRALEREHVEPVALLVRDILDHAYSPEELVTLLETRLVICTVLASEHRRLASGGTGWSRYEAAGIKVRRGVDLPEVT